MAQPVEQVLAKLSAVQSLPRGPGGRQRWRAACPMATDHVLNISARPRDGVITLHCGGGCTPEAIRAAVGLSPGPSRRA